MAYIRNRYRSDTELKTFVEATHRDSDGALLWGPVPVERYVGSLMEEFSDSVGFKNVVNYAHHWRVEAVVEPPPLLKQNWGSTATYFTGGDPFFSFTRDFLIGLLPLVPVPLRESLCGDALTSFTDEFKPQVDLVNFAFETSAIEELIPRISSSITKSASGAFLGWKFGIKPALSDLRSLAGVSNYVARRLAWLRSSYGQTVRVGFTRRFDIEPQGEYLLYQDGSLSGNTVKLKLVNCGGLFRAGGFLTHRLSGLDGISAEALALSAALGTQNPAAILWEAIPFSFVADWFTRVQELVATLNVQPFKGEYKLERVSHSFKTFANFRYVLHKGGSWSSESNTDSDYGTLSVERYERYPNLPASSSLLTGETLSPTQQLLALSLIRQRF